MTRESAWLHVASLFALHLNIEEAIVSAFVVHHISQRTLTEREEKSTEILSANGDRLKRVIIKFLSTKFFFSQNLEREYVILQNFCSSFGSFLIKKNYFGAWTFENRIVSLIFFVFTHPNMCIIKFRNVYNVLNSDELTMLVNCGFLFGFVSLSRFHPNVMFILLLKEI